MIPESATSPAASGVIPPLPAGGSWRWDGLAWISRDPVAAPVAESATAPVTETPAEALPHNEE